MRIAFVSPAGTLGGSERSLLDLIASLGEAAPTVERSLLMLADGELATHVRKLDVSVHVLPLPETLATLGESRAPVGSGPPKRSFDTRAAVDALRYATAFRRTLLEWRPDIIHTNGMKAHVLAAAAIPDVRRVVHFRDFPSERQLTRRVLPYLGLRSIIVANSRAVAADVRRYAPLARTRVVYNGIDTAEFSPGPATLSLAALAGLPEATPETLNVGLVATYAWWKGHRRFLEAAERVLASDLRIPVRFYVVGGPVYRTAGSEVTELELRTLIRQRRIEDFVGLVPFQQNPAAVYRSLDVVVHASERPEPFGRTIVEAMATGRAVVVARQGGAAELFEDGTSALGYDPRIEGDLPAALLRLLRDATLRTALGEAAHAHAVARFDRRRLGPELLNVYRELLA